MLIRPSHTLLAAASAALVSVAAAAPSPGSASPAALSCRAATAECRCFPGDACWPSADSWAALNTTVGGRLVRTVPLAAPCHDSEFGPYDADACAAIQAAWDETVTHYSSSSSIMQEFFANQSCEPFYPKSASCTVGAYVQYAVNATSAADFQAAIAFAKQNNIRLVIRNTGHDYLGKSTGAGSLAIWTHHMKDMTLLPNYSSGDYSGAAIKFGAGVQVLEAFKFAHESGHVVVGGNCQTVGIAGGYSQGGGHGALASVFGMAADQVLEWEVVTGTGELLIASPSENADLYWALAGGGGSAYGAVVSMTSRAHPDLPTSGANMTFTPDGVTADQYYDVVHTYIEQIEGLIDQGAALVWWVNSASFAMTPATGPNMTAAQFDAAFEPVLAKLKGYNMTYTYESHDFATYLDENLAMDLPYEISNLNMGGRLVQREVLQKNMTGLMDTIRAINGYNAIVSGISIDASKKPGHVDNAVNPYWRDAAIDVVIGLSYNFTDWNANIEEQATITNTLMPLIEEVSPNSGSYMNEADFHSPDYKITFYGGNWDKLQAVKDKYDPDQIFYALTAVGSDKWTQDASGRLCKVKS